MESLNPKTIPAKPARRPISFYFFRIEYWLAAWALLASGFFLAKSAEPAWAAAELGLHAAVTVGLASALQFGLIRWLARLRHSPKNAAITGLLLFLILYPSDPWLAAAATVLATAAKYLVFRGATLLNPAAAGILALLIASQFVPSLEPFAAWWGVSFGGIATLFSAVAAPENAWLSQIWFGVSIGWLLSLAWLVCAFKIYKLKWPLLASYFAVLFVGLVACLQMDGLRQCLFLLCSATVPFLAGFMLLDPRTSPIRRGQQIAAGAAAGAVHAGLLALTHLGLAPAVLAGGVELLAIVAMNLAFAAARLLQAAKPASTPA